MGKAIKVYAYIDGFNLYYGAVKGTPYRWLDLVELTRLLLPSSHIIERVKYFTARVSGAADPDAPRRQQIYLNALGTFPIVEVHYGHFLAKTVWRPLTNLPIAGRSIKTTPPIVLPAGIHDVDGAPTQQLPVGSYPPSGSHRRKAAHKKVRPLPNAVIAESHTMEEKGSDVNLAVHLLNDAWKGSFDVAAVISNDTDLVQPIRMVSVERGKPVFVICPGRWQISPPLNAVATNVRHIRNTHLQRSQLPNPIPGTTIRKPPSW